MKALFDADIIVFRAGFAAEKNRWYLKLITGMSPGTTADFQYKVDALAYLDECLPGIRSREEGVDYQLWSEREVEPLEHALHNTKILIDKCLTAVDCTEFDAIMYLSGGTNFRYDVAKTKPYKGNRDDRHRPTYEDAIRRYIRAKYETVVTEGIEADDALGIAQTKFGPHDSVIISLDKDLDMIPGFKYNFVNEIHYDVPEDVALRTYAMQLLTGDATDNIPGLNKVGKVKAEKMLANIPPEDLLDEVARQYASRTGKEDWYEYMVEQATLLWIQQEPDQPAPLAPPFEESTDESIETNLFD